MNHTIDFDKASLMWMSNKIAVGNGTYKYVCGATRKDGGKCKNSPYRHHKLCHIHFKVKSQSQTFESLNLESD